MLHCFEFGGDTQPARGYWLHSSKLRQKQWLRYGTEWVYWYTFGAEDEAQIWRSVSMRESFDCWCYGSLLAFSEITLKVLGLRALTCFVCDLVLSRSQEPGLSGMLSSWSSWEHSQIWLLMHIADKHSGQLRAYLHRNAASQESR